VRLKVFEKGLARHGVPVSLNRARIGNRRGTIADLVSLTSSLNFAGSGSRRNSRRSHTSASE
jgi:hypothetical protein